MDGYLAKKKSENKWFQRLDTNVPESGFVDSVAEQFGVAPTDIEVVKKPIPSEADRAQIALELAQGLHDNLPVIPTAEPQGPVIATLLTQDTTGLSVEQKLARLEALVQHIFKAGNLTV